MTEIDIYLTATITILGVAYPILLQVIARLDEKYSSDHIVELFNLEWELKAFKYSLKIALVLIVIWSLKLVPLFSNDFFDIYINNSAAILIAVVSVFLVITFFLLVDKILTYYTPTKIIPYFIKRQKESQNDFKYFEALTDILLISIRKQERNHTETLSMFYYLAFKMEREKSGEKPVEYPDLYYDAVYIIIEELAILKEKRNRAFEVRAGGGLWLLGELSGYEISEKTYTWLWRNLLLMIVYDNQDMIFDYWKTAFQYITYSLAPVFPKPVPSEGGIEIVNQAEVDKRKKERNRFEEFHFAMGGLLLYSNKFELLSKMFGYTQSQPPSYELLPDSMTEVFIAFNKFRDPYDTNFSWISSKYSFPGLGGLASDSIVKNWISKYMAILFLRQYSLQSYLVTMRPLAFPTMPRAQSEVREWIDGMDYFKSLVQEILDNEVLLKVLGFDFITRSWSEKKHVAYPTDYIDEVKKKLQGEYAQKAYTQEVAIEKVDQFELATTNVLLPVLQEVLVLNNNNELGNEVDKWYINGKRMLFSKDAFSENPEAHYIDFDNFLANRVAEVIREGIASTFLFKKSKSYLLEAQNIFKAIEKLNIGNDYIIINYGLDLQSYIDKQTDNLTLTEFNGVKILTITETRNVRNSLFVLKRSSLPSIEFNQVEKDTIKKFSLKKLIPDINLYTSVIDLNVVEAPLLNEVRNEKEDEELRRSVLLYIDFVIEIQWGKESDIIQIVESSPYRQQGILSTVNDVVPFQL